MKACKSVCLNNIGAVYFEKAQYEDARTYYQQALQLREKAKVPGDIVQTVQNLADTAVRMGQYDQAVSQYMRALELWRSTNDSRGAAITSYTLGVMFEYQGQVRRRPHFEADGPKDLSGPERQDDTDGGD